LVERVYKLESLGTLVFSGGKIEAEAGDTSGIKTGVDLLQLPEGANHQARADDEDHRKRNLCDHETLAQRLASASNRALPGAANPVREVAFADLGQWRETKEKHRKDRNPNRKREYGQTNANLVRARHAVGRKK